MSTRRVLPNRPSFAYQTNYDALAVDSGESEEEEILEAPESAPPVSTEPPVKLTKTAQRKAARAAREEKKNAKAAARHTSADDATPASDASRPETPALISRQATTDSTSDHVEPEPTPSTTATNGSAGTARTEEPAPMPPPTVKPTKPAPPLSTKAAAEPPDVPPEPPFKREVAPVVEPISKVVEDISAAASKAAEPVQAAFAKGAETAKEVLNKVPPQVAAVAAPDDAEKKKKRANVLERTLWTFIMIGGFLGLLLMGHAYMIVLVMFCQTLVYREVTALFSLKSQDKSDGLPGGKESQGRDPWSKTLNWYFFAITNYFLYGESIIYYFKHVVFVDAHLTTLANQHRFISFMLYTIGFVGFVASLKRGYLKQQFGLFCWVHMTLLLIVVSSHFIVNNILEGLIWFWVPASLVICNDIFAYICGVTMGRTPLIALSPKKTVEGFVGALFCTIVFGIWWGTYFMSFDYMVCPVRDLGVSAFDSVGCTRNPVFLWKDAPLPAGLATFLSTILGRSVTTIPYAPYQVHLFFLSCFASLVAPFGGFFASGFKRAFNIKDFGDSIPGHGGMTDRMDCQFLMGVFTYVYYTSLIRQHNVTVGSVLQTIVSGLTTEEQLQLIADLKRYIEGQGITVTV